MAACRRPRLRLNSLEMGCAFSTQRPCSFGYGDIMVPSGLSGSLRRMNAGPHKRNSQEEGNSTNEAPLCSDPTEAVQGDISQGRCLPFTWAQGGSPGPRECCSSIPWKKKHHLPLGEELPRWLGSRRAVTVPGAQCGCSDSSAGGGGTV